MSTGWLWLASKQMGLRLKKSHSMLGNERSPKRSSGDKRGKNKSKLQTFP